MSVVGVIGSGSVAKTLAKGALSKGYSCCIGSRTIDKVKAIAEEVGNGLEYGTLQEVGKKADIVILAVKGSAAETVVKSISREIAGKVVIDACNPIDEAAGRKDGIIQYFKLPGDVSLIEHLQTVVPEANFVKAFNSVGSGLMVDPKFKQGVPSMFICGNDAKAKATVTELLTKFGWETCDMGSAKSGYCIEQLCILWCARGFNDGKWNHAFHLLTE